MTKYQQEESASSATACIRAGVPDDSADARMLRTLIGNLDGMVFRCRADASSSMEFVSEGCVALTGYTAAELLADGSHPFA